MKNVKIFATAALLATASFATFAADLPTSQPAADAQKIGVVTVSGAANLSALESELASKAAASGASSYRIVAAGGKTNCTVPQKSSTDRRTANRRKKEAPQGAFLVLACVKARRQLLQAELFGDEIDEHSGFGR